MNLKTYTTDYTIINEYWEDEGPPPIIEAQKYAPAFALSAIFIFGGILYRIYAKLAKVRFVIIMWLVSFTLCVAYYRQFCNKIEADQYINGLNITDPPIISYVECTYNNTIITCTEACINSYVMYEDTVYSQTTIIRTFLDMYDVPTSPEPFNVEFAPWNVAQIKPDGNKYGMFIWGLVMNILLDLLCILAMAS